MSSTPEVDKAIEDAIQACESAIKRGVIGNNTVNSRVAYVQGYLKLDPLFRHFAEPVPAKWIIDVMATRG